MVEDRQTPPTEPSTDYGDSEVEQPNEGIKKFWFLLAEKVRNGVCPDGVTPLERLPRMQTLRDSPEWNGWLVERTHDLCKVFGTDVCSEDTVAVSQ